MEQLGGLKLINQHKQGFQAVSDMLMSSSCKIRVLTYDSLKGFMFVLDVSEKDSEYLKLTGSRFTERVTSFILKVAVVTNKNNENLVAFQPMGAAISKQSETKKSYYEESKLQQLIWKKSITGGKAATCPSVANFSLFDSKSSREFLMFVLSKVSSDPIAVVVTNYLLNQTNKYGHEIGIIVMPNIEGSKTLRDFLNLKNGTYFNGLTMSDTKRQDAVAHVLAQVVSLFFDVGVIHFDLHSGNVLISCHKNKLSSLLIDFGKVSNIMNGTKDLYFVAKKKKQILSIKNQMYNHFFMLIGNKDTPQTAKLEFMNAILGMITMLDHDINQKLYYYDNKNYYQMDWYEKYRSDVIHLKAFAILEKTFRNPDTKFSFQTLTQYELDGFLVDFEKNIKDFNVQFHQEPKNKTKKSKLKF